MSSTDIVYARPTGRPPLKPGNKTGKVGKKVKLACSLIVTEGLETDEAAKRAQLTTRTLREALQRKHVVAYLREQREVFREYVSAQNIHHAKRLRDNGRNETAIVNSMKYIDAQADAESAAKRQSVPGFVIICKGDVQVNEPPRDDG